LPLSAKLLIVPLPPRQLDIDAAHRFAIEAGDRTELQVDIEIDVLGFGLGVGFLARNRRLEKAATVEYIAAMSPSGRHRRHDRPSARSCRLRMENRSGSCIHQVAVLTTSSDP